MKELIKICIQNNIILFIDEIHTIYGTGSNDALDMAEMLKRAITRENLRVIGTTTIEKYNRYFASDDLKRRFEKIEILEPTEEILLQILNKVTDDFILKYNLPFEKEEQKKKVLITLIELTKKSHRDYKDVLNNPDLSISILDKAFAIANVEDSQFIEIKHFIESVQVNSYLYDTVKEKAILKLRNYTKEDFSNEQPKGQILKMDLYKKEK